MNKKKIIVYVLILIISGGVLILKEKIISKEDTYVLTEKEESVENIENSEDINEDINIDEKSNENEVSRNKITVYVSGAVKKQGIVTLEEGDRLSDAVEKLGGTTKKADLNAINMAIKIKDEEHYIIPKVGEKVANTTDKEKNKKDSNTDNNIDNNIEQSSSSEKININTADLKMLDELPGVGEATANKIITHREENGKFKAIEEIKNVNGIGDKKYEDMKELICVD